MAANEYSVEWPTLWVAAEWIHAHCVVPDGFDSGEPFYLSDWQAWFILNHYRVKDDAQWLPEAPLRAPAFHYRRSQLVMPQKALALDTPIATPTGWTTMADLRVGDEVFDRDGHPTRVIAKSQVWEAATYKVTFSDYSTLLACGDHEWEVEQRTPSATYVPKRVTTTEMFGNLTDNGGARKWRVRNAMPLQLPEADLPVDPYILGYWLGDGDSDGARFTVDAGDIPSFLANVELSGYTVGAIQAKPNNNSSRIGVSAPSEALVTRLRKLGVLHNKHIPASYLRADEKQRWALLQGLMDSDGYADERQGKCEFTATIESLSVDVSELLHSLGIKHRTYEGRATFEGKDYGPKYRISFAARSDMPVFRLDRKQARLKPSGTGHAQYEHRRVINVERVDTVATQCLTVASETHTFLAGREMIPTGNSGKGPLAAAQICLEAVGPALFAGWAQEGDTYRCKDHGCGCGWVYHYQPGEAKGMSWPTPLVQVTATSEEQTDNVYSALRPMINNGPLAHLIPKTGEQFIRLPGGGRIDTVTSNARSRLGQRVTFCVQDETGVWTAQTSMIKVAETQRRGLAGMAGRAIETTNAYDSAEDSVAQRTAETGAHDVFRYHPTPPISLSYTNKRDRHKIHELVYRGSPWVDLNAIEAEAVELLEVDPAQAERFFGNRVTAGAGYAYDPDAWAQLARPKHKVAEGALITIGVDGARFEDALAVIATEVETGHQWPLGIWEVPLGSPDEYEHPLTEVDGVVTDAFERFHVWRVYIDPQRIEKLVVSWQARWDTKTVLEWHTNRPKPMAHAVRRHITAVSAGDVKHSGDETFTRHIHNAVKKMVHVKDDEYRRMFVIKKDRPHSPKKMDAAVAAIISWEARNDAIADGAMNIEPPRKYRVLGLGVG